MSQSQLVLDELVVDVGAYGGPGGSLQFLSEFADHAFALADQHAGVDTSDIPLGVTSRFANMVYSVGNTIPTSVHLYQSAPGVLAQQVAIDFQARTVTTVEFEGQLDLAIESERIGLVQDEIKRYLQDMRERNRKRERERFLQQNIDWRDFLERLESNDMLPHSDSDAYIHKRCPLCETQTVSCTSCRSVMCSNEACAVFQLIPSQSCSQHGSTAVCLLCLQRDHDKNEPRLGQCPRCEHWFCRFELTWCLGRPKDESDRSPSSYHRSIPIGNRAHPMKPVRCSPCAGTQDKPRCCNPKCWSRRDRCTGICGSCSLGDGLWCTCERCWLCEDCRTSRTNIFKECPRCKRAFCVYECDYIQFCAECGRSTLCDDCVEEDSTFLGPDVADGVVVMACCTSHCLGKICKGCLEGTRCAGCKETFCSSCTRWQICGNGRLCPSCI